MYSRNEVSLVCSAFPRSVPRAAAPGGPPEGTPPPCDFSLSALIPPGPFYTWPRLSLLFFRGEKRKKREEKQPCLMSLLPTLASKVAWIGWWRAAGVQAGCLRRLRGAKREPLYSAPRPHFGWSSAVTLQRGTPRTTERSTSIASHARPLSSARLARRVQVHGVQNCCHDEQRRAVHGREALLRVRKAP